jgi:sarcosine oxidase subunit alpha
VRRGCAPGGRLLSERCEIGGEPGHVWAERAGGTGSMPAVRVMPRSTVFGVYDGGTYAASSA